MGEVSCNVQSTEGSVITPASDPPCPPTLQGTTDEYVYQNATGEREVNVWYGPTAKYLLKYGAKYAPCMRNDANVESNAAAQRAEECGSAKYSKHPCSPSTCSAYGDLLDENICAAEADSSNIPNGYSCCCTSGSASSVGAERCAMANFTYCNSVCSTPATTSSYGDNDDWVSSPGCWQVDGNNKRTYCDERTKNVVARPCCYGSRGKCMITTNEQCSFIDGTWHSDEQLCSDVSCIQSLCKLATGEGVVDVDPKFINTVKDPGQWYRFIAPIFVPAGLIQFLLYTLVQWEAGRQIERHSGFLRIGIIYMMSGIGGVLSSAYFLPYDVSSGPAGAIFGLLAVLLIEILQSWAIIPHVHKEFGKLVAIIIGATLLGTMPLVDNMRTWVDSCLAPSRQSCSSRTFRLVHGTRRASASWSSWPALGCSSSSFSLSCRFTPCKTPARARGAWTSTASSGRRA